MEKTYKIIVWTLIGQDEERYVRTDDIDGYVAELQKELKSVPEWRMRYDKTRDDEPWLYIDEITIEDY